MKARLGVNIDHMATLRQARGENYPSLVDGARAVLEAGADQITIHLREDRRHIQDYDVPAIKMVTERYGVPLNLEMGADNDIIEVALAVKPDWVCLVPEKREERTTEGGLDLIDPDNFNRVKKCCERLKEAHPNTKISLFIEANEETIARSIELGVEAVEIHTGDYAIDFNEEKDLSVHYEKYKNAYSLIEKSGKRIGFHAGHGLTDESVRPLVELGLFEEYNIGHWIICQAVFDGLEKTVKNLKKIIEG